MGIRPKPLRPGDVVRIVSPASRPDEAHVNRCAQTFEDWGLKVQFGRHVLGEYGILAGTDEDRASDLNAAICDPSVSAIYASRGGKGSYRIVEQIDYAALRKDPKYIVGFSDITALHLALWRHCGIVSLHGGLFGGQTGIVGDKTKASLHAALMAADPIVVASRPDEATSALTTSGFAQGRLLGGNLSIIGTSAGWLLPNLRDAILLIEAIDMGPGLIDRTLQMLRKAGHLDGIAGVAIGQFTNVNLKPPLSVIDLLREHLGHLDVPILGGLPIGHGFDPVTVPHGRVACLDANKLRLEFEG